VALRTYIRTFTALKATAFDFSADVVYGCFLAFDGVFDFLALGSVLALYLMMEYRDM
jgi:hypothetical protein